jgi:hypothetical protein
MYRHAWKLFFEEKPNYNYLIHKLKEEFDKLDIFEEHQNWEIIMDEERARVNMMSKKKFHSENVIEKKKSSS